MLRRLIKQALAGFIYYSGLWRLITKRRGPAEQLPFILMYHAVLPASDSRRRMLQPGMIVSPEQFERQMKLLNSRYEAITLTRLAEQIATGTRTDKNQFVVTFDDGWLDNCEFALPILTRLNIPATIFLTTDVIESNQTFWFIRARQVWQNLERASVLKILDKLESITGSTDINPDLLVSDFDGFAEFVKTLDPKTADDFLNEIDSSKAVEPPNQRWVLNWDEITRMTAGRIDFGSHGQTHTILTRLKPDQVASELTASRRIIREKIGGRIDMLAYPNGNSNESVRQSARSAGYSLAVRADQTNAPDKVDIMDLPRIGIHDGCSLSAFGRFSPALFVCHLHGIF